MAAGPFVPPSLTARDVGLRPLGEDDRDDAGALLMEPDVARWWHTDPEKPADHVLSLDPDQFALVIENGGVFAGVLLISEEMEADYRHAALDIALGEAAQGRGIGPVALALAIDWLTEERGHHRVTIDPACANERAIRAYEKVGFSPVGVMRAYERGTDGSWHDNLLMDLVRLGG